MPDPDERDEQQQQTPPAAPVRNDALPPPRDALEVELARWRRAQQLRRAGPFAPFDGIWKRHTNPFRTRNHD